MCNLVGPLNTDLASINGSMTKIVTKTEILALVSMLLSTYFIWYWPILGDILTENNLLILFLQNRSASAGKHFLGSKQPNIVVSMLMYHSRSIVPVRYCHLSEHHSIKRAHVGANEYWAILGPSVVVWSFWECQHVIRVLAGCHCVILGPWGDIEGLKCVQRGSRGGLLCPFTA